MHSMVGVKSRKNTKGDIVVKRRKNRMRRNSIRGVIGVLTTGKKSNYK